MELVEHPTEVTLPTLNDRVKLRRGGATKRQYNGRLEIFANQGSPMPFNRLSNPSNKSGRQALGKALDGLESLSKGGKLPLLSPEEHLAQLRDLITGTEKLKEKVRISSPRG